MSSPIVSAQRRALRFGLALLVACFAIGPALAGPGHDHGPAPSGTSSPPSPRAVASSETFQFVGIAEGEVLVIYLDRFADNAPVTSATLEVTIGDQVARAELQKNGTYEVISKLLKTPGEHAVLVNITDGAVADLLVSSVVIPDADKAAAGAGFDHQMWSHLHWPASPAKLTGIGFGALLLMFGVVRLSRTRRLPGLLATVAGLALVAASTAYAGPGHDHGGGGAEGGGNGNAPARQPDGTIFLPKPTQRLLEVRTRIMAPETAQASVRFQGRIIANPNKSGIVQSTIQGRYAPPPSGVPAIGTRVKAGDLMGRVAASFASKEASDVAQTLAELDQQIAATNQKLARQEQLFRAGVVSKPAVDEQRIQLEGYAKRRADLLESRIQAEDLRAPVDGVVVLARVVPGQVVAQADQIFQIVDPSSFLVEALMFEQGATDQIGEAVATFGDGKSAKLKFLGRSRSLQQQYSVLKFEVVDPHPDLNVGTPVIVVGVTGQPITGLRLPRAAIAQAPNGQSVVFVHKEAETFEPRAVRFEPFDADSVLIAAGLEAGDKVVVRNAPLVNQVR